MKTIITLLFVLSISIYSNAQQLTQTYPGTWHYQNGNQLFIVKIWQDGQKMKGHYKMITVDGNGNQTGVVYNSRRDYGYGNRLPYILLGSVNNELSGVFGDNTIASTGMKMEVSPNPNATWSDDFKQNLGVDARFLKITGYDRDYKPGEFEMKIIPFLPGCTSCVVAATWKVSDTPGMKVGQDPPFSVPTNITLTKVSETITLD